MATKTRQEIIEVLRQAWRELDFECSSTADDLSDVIFLLAHEWGVELTPVADTAPKAP